MNSRRSRYQHRMPHKRERETSCYINSDEGAHCNPKLGYQKYHLYSSFISYDSFEVSHSTLAVVEMTYGKREHSLLHVYV